MSIETRLHAVEEYLKIIATKISRRFLSENDTEYFSLPHESFDLTKTNNGIDTVKYPALIIRDKNDLVAARLEAIINPSGQVGVQMYAQNYDTAGQVKKHAGIRVDVDKTGSVEYTVDDYTKFQKAINVVPNVMGHSDKLTSPKTTNLSYSTTGLSIYTMRYTTNTGYYKVVISAECQTSTKTSGFRIYCAGTQIGLVETNSTTPDRLVIIGTRRTTKGATEDINLSLYAQDSSTTATMPAYRTYQIYAEDIPWL